MNDCEGTIVVQDLFQLNFCVTRAYNTQAWRKHCKYVVRRITSKWFDQNWWRSKKENLVDIFEYSFEATKNTKKSPSKESKSKLEISWSWTYGMPNKRMKSNLLKLKKKSPNSMEISITICTVYLLNKKNKSVQNQTKIIDPCSINFEKW